MVSLPALSPPKQMFGGHYSSFVNHDVAMAADGTAGKWFSMDDESVRMIPSSQVITGAAYVLFYRRRKPLALASDAENSTCAAARL
jgi:hypothetical protein